MISLYYLTVADEAILITKLLTHTKQVVFDTSHT